MAPRLHLATLFVVLFSSAALAADRSDIGALEEQAFKQAAALADPFLVRIQTVGGLDTVDGVLTVAGPTSGVVVSEDGYIISSAFNFAAKPASILVRLADGRQLPADLVATDRSKMLTLLKVEADGLTPAPAAEKKSVRVGQWAIALGRTYEGPLPSVSVGIVSALNRVWGRAIQTDAKVSPLNYGGPLVGLDGKVLGVLVPLSPQGEGETAGVEWYDSGIGFAIPMDDVYAAVERLKSGDDLKRGLLGINFKGGLGITSEDVRIDRVRVESPADKAGLTVGDVVTEVDGKPVGRPADVLQALGGKYAGDEVRVSVKRGDETIRKTIKLVAELVPYESGFLGILPVRDAADEAGVGVRFVFEDSPAAKAGLQARDRIRRIGDEEVTDAAMLLDRISRVRPGESVRLTWTHDDAEQAKDVTLAAIPSDIPAELPTSPIPPRAEDDKEKLPKTGRFSAELPGSERGYWAYVPEDYNPADHYGLMVWIQPAGDTMEATIIKEWKSVCDRRGLLIVAPKAETVAGWTPNDAEFVQQVVDEFRKTYAVDPARVFVHGTASGGPMAYQLAFKYRDLFPGVAVVNAPLRAVREENDPDHRQQFYLLSGEKGSLATRVKATAEGLRTLKFPVSLTTFPESDAHYPPADTIDQLGRWADLLDRI